MERPSGPESVLFELLREQWNEYTFSDHVVVRTKLVLRGVLREFEFGALAFDFEKVTTVSAPEMLRGEQSQFIQGTYPGKVPRFECPILLRDEKWNECSLGEETKIAKFIFLASKAFKLADAYDNFGQPIYVIEGKPLIKVCDPDTGSSFAIQRNSRENSARTLKFEELEGDSIDASDRSGFATNAVPGEEHAWRGAVDSDNR